MTTITSHGFKFHIHSDGFVRFHAEADRDRGIAAIEAALDQMPAAHVGALHAADLAWYTADCEGKRPAMMDEIEVVGMTAATEGWRNPNAVMLSVSAAQ